MKEALSSGVRLGENNLVPSKAMHGNHKPVLMQKPLQSDGSELTANGGYVEVPSDFRTTPEAIRNMAPSDAQLNAMPKLGQESGANKALDDELLVAEKGFAQRMGLKNTPQIIVSDVRGKNFSGIPDVSSGFTKEGTPYISMNKAALEKLSPRELKSILALETDRLKHGDGRPEHYAAADKQTLFSDTYRADRSAAGPNGTNDPLSLASALQKGEVYRKNALIEARATDLRDPEHPPAEGRIKRLEQQAKMQKTMSAPSTNIQP
jgi:hypothetical protein